MNFSLADQHRHEPLYVWAVSAKRYALFNLDAEGTPILRKASAHGLGHLRAPYDEKNPPPGIPAPKVDLGEVALWQHDLWWKIIRAALDGHPDQVDLGYHPALSQPAISRYAATTPKLLKWFKRLNKGRPYRDQVKPFGFMYSLFARWLTDASCDGSNRGKRCRASSLRPVALFDRDLARAINTAFDRDTGEKVTEDQLQSYRANLAQYHLSSEAKFLNGSYTDRGTTIRRTVVVGGIEAIGKEANRWEEQFYLGLSEDAEVSYGAVGDPNAGLARDLRELAKHIGQRELANWLGWPRTRVAKLLSSKPVRLSRLELDHARHHVGELRAEVGEILIAQQRARAELADRIARIGLERAAAELGSDPSNLLKIARGIRPPTHSLITRLQGGCE